jgi:hypothetical protein
MWADASRLRSESYDWVIQCGQDDGGCDCESLAAAATPGTRYMGAVALTSERQSSSHEAVIF